MKTLLIIRVKKGTGDYVNRWFLTVTDNRNVGLLVMTNRQFYAVLSNSSLIEEDEVVDKELLLDLKGASIICNASWHKAGDDFIDKDGNTQTYRKAGYHISEDLLESDVRVSPETRQLNKNAKEYARIVAHTNASRNFAQKILEEIEPPTDVEVEEVEEEVLPSKGKKKKDTPAV